MKTILKRSITALLCACALGAATQVKALTIGDAFYVGYIDPATPANAASEIAAINQLIGLAIGSHTISGIAYNHVALIGLPSALAAGADQGDAPSANVNVSGFEYVLGKYGTRAHVWYVATLNGNQAIPQNANGNNLSHFSRYNSNPPDTGTGVPDGGATVALLGLGIVALGASRRFIKG